MPSMDGAVQAIGNTQGPPGASLSYNGTSIPGPDSGAELTTNDAFEGTRVFLLF